MHIRFDKTDGFIRIYDATRYVTLFGSAKYDAVVDKVRHLVSLKSGITYIFSDYSAQVEIDSYDFLPVGKILTLHNVIILTKSVVNKDKNHYY